MRRSHGLIATVLPVALLVAVQTATAGRHPSLVDPNTTKCTTCHNELIAKKVVHAATEDCLSCHEFSKRESQTWVELAASPPELCIICHDSLEQAAAGELAAPHYPVTDTCLNCHQPHGSDHERLLVSTAHELCVTCHDSGDTDAAHPVPVSRADCRLCHTPHGSAIAGMLKGEVLHPPFADKSCEGCHRRGLGTRIRLQAKGATLCYACHSDKEEEFALGVAHTAVRQGLCTGCHSPHLSNLPRMLERQGNDLCFACHAEVRAKVVGKGAHAAVESGCETCHDPHQSAYAAHTVEPVPDLCLICHDADDEELRKKHLSADMSTVRCTTCHDPHGSSVDHLLNATSIHPPFAEESCDTCHEGSASNVMEEGSKTLCYACHTEIEEIVTSSTVQHAALEVDECTACHTPHASKEPKLVSMHAGGACLACHDDQGAGEGEVLHGAIEWFGCQACHEPHGSANGKLLRASVNELCTGCHVVSSTEAATTEVSARRLLGRFPVPAEKVSLIKTIQLSGDGTRNHPVVGHLTLGEPRPDGLRRGGVQFSGTMSCVSCHNPHKGESEKLLRRSCNSCHVK